jgi:FlaA1/EpsC-like NDP-sugar epimerase
VPHETRRYFISHDEAADICLLAGFVAPTERIAIPAFDPSRHLVHLEDVAARVLEAYGLEPWFTDDEAAAKQALPECQRRRRWPVLRTPLDTSGEKPYEEFVGDDESSEEIGFSMLRGVRHRHAPAVHTVVADLAAMVDSTATGVDKQKLVDLIARGVPMLRHVETGRDLDQRM